MQRQSDHDGNEAVGEPVRRRNSEEVGTDPHRAADPLVFEEVEPGQGQRVGRKHIGDNGKDRDRLFERHVGANHQPGHQPAQQHRRKGDGQRGGQRVDQRPIKDVDAQRAREDANVVKESPGARLGRAADAAVRFLPDGRVMDELQKGNHHQTDKDHHEQQPQDHLGLPQFQAQALEQRARLIHAERPSRLSTSDLPARNRGSPVHGPRQRPHPPSRCSSVQVSGNPEAPAGRCGPACSL